MAVSMVKIRAFVAGVVAIVVLVVGGSVAITALGADLPLIGDIAGIFGVEPGAANE
ncbi:MAG: hypothetical protein VCD00_13365 [Candidatus Hydrogenedentota bacterium]|jgi:hypothetical protein